MKTKFNYQQFDIGDWVNVNKKLVIISSGSERKKIDLPGSIKSIQGRISGVKVFRTGKISISYWSEDPTEFTHKSTITCWEIRIGLLNKPIHALPENIELCAISEMENLELPVIAGRYYTWSEQDRKSMREAIEDQPRDPGGRWIIHENNV